MATADESPAVEPVSNRGAALRIGELLIESGLLTREQAGEVAKHSIQNDVRFGEAAVALGYVGTEDVEALLSAGLEGRTIAEPARISEQLIPYHAPQSTASEDVRTLRNVLTLHWFQHPGGRRVLSIISPSRGDGRSVCTANLAVAFAQIGMRTLLIDADMRNPTQHRLFGLSNRAGLSGYLADRESESAHYTIPNLDMLTVIPVGPLPPSPQELLLRPTLPALLDSAALQFEAVLIDTPSASSGNDYQILSKAAGGALLLAHERTSRMRDAAKMVSACQDLGVKIVGGSLIKPHAR